jgi:transcription antitermination factor NusG
MSDSRAEENLDKAQKAQWFALTVTPKLTEQVLTALARKGYECFTPWQRLTSSTRGGRQERRVLAFPGYVFARMDIRLRYPALVTPGVRGIVGYGRQPAAIDDAEIDSLLRVLSSGMPAEAVPAMRSGDQIVLSEGPLAGLTGVLARIKNRDRVLVQVTLINQALAVDVDASWIRLPQSAA